MRRLAICLLVVPGVAPLGAPALAASPSVQLAQATVEVIAPSAPPAVREEVVPPPPSATVTWEPGFWSWSGANWQWVSGHYVERPSPQAVWEPGHWTQAANNGWLWIQGRWRAQYP